MDKNILEQYIELKGEIQDLKDRIDKDERRLAKIEKEGVVSDTVKARSESPAIRFLSMIG